MKRIGLSEMLLNNVEQKVTKVTKTSFHLLQRKKLKTQKNQGFQPIEDTAEDGT